MNLDVYNTHMELYPYVREDYPIIEKMYTAVDKFSGSEKPCGYMIEDGKLLLPRGTSISKIEYTCDINANIKTESDPYENMSRKFFSLYDPRDKLQEDSIKFLTEEKNHQLALNLATGKGKSYVTAYAISQLNIKSIIITPNETLKNQWITKTFSGMFDYRSKNLINIASSNIIDAIMEDLIGPADIYFVNHQTLRSYMTSTNGYMLHQFFKKIKVGIKVYDESHMMFDNILLLDFYTNTDRTWYLTATFDRSDKTESACFKRAFNSVDTFGEIESKAATRKHVIYHKVDINSRITPKERATVISYTGMTAASYGKYAFFRDPNDTAYNAILMILNKIKDVEGKTLIFIPLIDAIDEVVKKLKRDHSCKSIAAYHSRCTKDEKESAEKKDIIVSSIKSLGTGKDISGLRNVICVEPIASKVVAEQMIGRLRPYAEDKDTYFWDIVDICIPAINWWHRARFKKIETLVKEIVNINLDK